ncbi:hypothetical protein [Carnobacterium sp.]|uniref:hypothetical protein n=1 Tax=Carnobacterium sp. TaxID=48221 RepID=UPI003C711C32
MILETKETKRIFHPGYGSGSGVIVKNVYICPCGEAFVYYEKDDVPGFVESETKTDCKECNKKYHFQKNNAELKTN